MFFLIGDLEIGIVGKAIFYVVIIHVTDYKLTTLGALQVRSRWRQNNDSIAWRSQLTGVRGSGRMGK